MQNNKNLDNARDIVHKDAVDIYLGNLNTVDTDLKLPEKGVRGSDIKWHSGEILFLSHDGKITRPTHGVGNRIVSLTATLTYQDAVFEKPFSVTVIEQPNSGYIKAVNPVNITSRVHESPKLPMVVIVEKDTGSFTTAKVHWDVIEKKLFDLAGNFTVFGQVENSEIQAVARISMIEENPQTRKYPNEKQVFSFPNERVCLKGDSLFSHAQKSFLQYLLTVNDDNMLYNFRTAAELDTKGAPPMTGWDSPDCNLKGHTTGHYLSALSLAYAATHDEHLIEKLNYMVEELEKCQDTMSSMPGCRKGFLSGYSEEQFDLLEVYTTYPKIWAPYYTLHKIMAGLLDSYRFAHIDRALTVCSQLGDWVYNRLSILPREQLNKMWSMYIAGEFGGMMEVLGDLYFATGNVNYLTAANYFINDKLYFPMSENVDTLEDMHVNQHIPQIIGAIKLFEAQGDDKYFKIAKNFWQIVTHDHLYNIGGIGENEMFKSSGKVAAYISDKTAESCATYNMLKLTRELFMYLPEKAYMDYYEKALLNHTLSACDFYETSGGTTYFMPLAPASQKAFQTTENTCCHGTGLESPFKFTDAIYFYNADVLYVNLYIPSEAVWAEKAVVIQQATANDDPSKFSISINGAAKFALKLRKPNWVTEAVDILINGKIEKNLTLRDGYFEIERLWDNDVVQIRLPLSFHLDHTPDDPTLSGISYGPYTLVALSDTSEYLPLKVSDENINSKMKVKEDGKRFELDGITFVPLNQINCQTYCAYFRVK